MGESSGIDCTDRAEDTQATFHTHINRHTYIKGMLASNVQVQAEWGDIFYGSGISQV